MPFSLDAVVELKRREGWDNKELADAIGMSRESVYQWGFGFKPKICTIDRLYSLARKRGHKDLEFYVSPDLE